MEKKIVIGVVVVVVLFIGGIIVVVNLNVGDLDLVVCGVFVVVGSGIGGLFELVNSKGEIVIDVEVIIQLLLIYFGYMFCFDVCFFDIVWNVQVVQIFEDQGIEVIFVFILIDLK